MNSLPKVLSGSSAWLGKTMLEHPERWLYTLSTQDIADIESAADHFQSLGSDVGEITKETFPLKTFGQHVDQLKSKILTGVGVEVIRGLPIQQYSQKYAASIFCGIGAHLGNARS